MTARKKCIKLLEETREKVEELGKEAQELADLGHRHHAREERLQEEADAIEDAFSEILSIIEDLKVLDE